MFQDEFKRWFRAKVRVVLAPGKSPFDGLGSQTTLTVTNGHTTHHSDSPLEDLHRKGSKHQLVQVGHMHAHAHVFTHVHVHVHMRAHTGTLHLCVCT